jgi:hypothetical protein
MIGRKIWNRVFSEKYIANEKNRIYIVSYDILDKM